MKLQFLTWREWRARPGRAWLTVFSVAIAVAAVLGTSLAKSTVRRAYSEMSSALEGPPAMEVVAAEGGRFPLEEVPQLSDIPGVQATVPLMFRVTGARASGQRWKALVAGVPSAAESAWRGLELADGRLPTESNEALVDAGLASSLGLKLPQKVVLLSRRGTTSLSLVGAVSAKSIRDLAEGATLIVPLATAHKMFGFAGRVDRVKVLLTAGEQRDQVSAELARRLPASLITQKPVANIRLADEVLRSTELALEFASLLAMAMAAFIILNTLRMNFSERRRQFSIMRAIGASAAQIRRLLLTEGVVIGVLGVCIGIPLALGLSYALAQGMQNLMQAKVPLAAPSLGALALGVIAGPLVALIAAWAPARESQKLSPLEGITGIEPMHRDRYGWRPVLASLLCTLAALGGLTLVALEYLDDRWAIPTGLATLMAFIFLIPAVLRPILRTLGRHIPRLLHTEALLASRQMQQRVTRTGLTVGVLVVAIANGLGLGHAIMNNVNDVRNWHRRAMAADFFLEQLEKSPSAGVTEELEARAELTKLPGVTRTTTMRLRPARAEGESLMCVIRDFSRDASLPWDIPAAEEPELRSKLADGQVVLSSIIARRLNLQVGDELRLEVQGRSHQRPVAAVVSDYLVGGLVIFWDREAASRAMELGPVDVYLINCQANFPKQLEGQLGSFARDQGLVLHSFADFRRYLDQLINGVVGALFALLGLGFVVGGFGIANTLAMSVLEQTRELGLLRIVGMTQRQIRRLVLVEGLMLGMVGVLLGVAAGMVTAFLIHFCNRALLDRDVPFQLHGWLLLANIVGCLLVAAIAAWFPGRRAANLDVLAAIAYE